jgi:UDP-glucose 4-epimerase
VLPNIPKIIVASSETVYGVCFAQGDVDYKYFPLEEDYDVDPEDSYALSKICAEKTAVIMTLACLASISSITNLSSAHFPVASNQTSTPYALAM